MEGLLCPITLQPFEDPVVLETGITYERQAIKHWLVRNNTCPVSRRVIGPLIAMIPNFALCPAVEGPGLETFVVGAMSSTLLSVYLTTASPLPGMIDAVRNRVAFEGGRVHWTLRDAALIFPQLAQLCLQRPDLDATFYTLLGPFLSKLPPGLTSVMAMRILAESVCICPRLLDGAWRGSAPRLLELSLMGTVQGAG